MVMPARAKSLKKNALDRAAVPDLMALDRGLQCFRHCAKDFEIPAGGWVRAIQRALGITNVELAARLGRVPQTIEDMQKSETAGSIKIQSLRMLAGALDCRLVYVLVPNRSLVKMRDEQAHALVARVASELYRAGRRGAGGKQRNRDVQRLVEKVIASQRRLLK
jgi:predicted DNA-binding mobile mystery protein A